MDILFHPVKLLADFITYNVFFITHGTLLAESVNFFIYDSIKILLLLAVIIFVVSVIRTFLPADKIRSVLLRMHPFVGNVSAGLFGIITPFCTCSAVPLFIGFLEAGVPLGTTFSFLIASPLINEIALVLLLGLFGWKIALVYIASGLIISVVSGLIIGRLNVENLVEEFISRKDPIQNSKEATWGQRAQYAKRYTLNIIKKVWAYILIGIGLGAFIHGYVPADFLVNYAGGDKWYAVPLATLIGIPLYSNAAGVIPLVSVLTEKGVSIGATLAFMMAVTGLSFPEFIILKKVMKTKLIVIFATVVGLGILFTGYLFNLILR